MKKLFNHRKRPYDDNIDYDEWNEIEASEAEGYEADEEFEFTEATYKIKMQ